MFAKMWHFISYLGVKKDTPEYLRDKIILTNRIVITLFIYIADFSRFAFQESWIIWIVLIQVAIFFSIWIANNYGKVLLSRCVLAFFIPLMVLIVGSLMSHGPNYAVRMPILTALFGPLLLFDLYLERRWMVAGIIWNFIRQFHEKFSSGFL